MFAFTYRSIIHLKLTFVMYKGGFKVDFSHACVQLFQNYFVNKNFTFRSFIDGHLGDSDQRERRGRGKSGNMNRELMGKDDGWGLTVVGGAGKSKGENGGKIVIEQ